MVNIGIVGATGYVGIELIRLLINHPKIKLNALSSVSFEGKKVQEVYPNVAELIDIECTNSEEVVNKCDVIFTALPHGLSEKIVDECIKKQKTCIDIGADFRLNSEEEYKKWYGKEYDIKDIHDKAVYGLPEVYKDKIKEASVIANPGCYPTSAVLGLIPLLDKGLIDPTNIIIDAKSGTTGAGREPSQVTHFSECNENLIAYKIGSHRHIPEIEQTLSEVGKEKITVTFTPHLIPVNRGILSTIYCNPKENLDIDFIYKTYLNYYKDECFVRVLPLGSSANIRNIKHSNYCDISIHIDERTNKIIILSAIDNMIKGAAGQAVQNMNICMGWNEKEGLNLVPPAF